jgi:hypothetical protein
MTKIRAGFIIFVCMTLATGLSVVSAGDNSKMAGEQIGRQALSSGGSTGDSPGYTITGTAGQAVVITGRSAHYIAHHGFWEDHAAVITSCCIPPTVGDVDQSGGVDITDVQVLVDNQFLTLTPLVCEAEGDLDFSGVVDITDLQILIDNQFLTLTPLPPCP